MDGYNHHGKSGIFRYDFNYKYRKFIIPLGAFILIFDSWLSYKNQSALFVNNGLWLTPVIAIYFFLKNKNKIKPLAKMIIVAMVVSAVIVSLYNSTSFLGDFLSYERIIITLIVLLNQLVLEHFEFLEEEKSNQPLEINYYYIIIFVKGRCLNPLIH